LEQIQTKKKNNTIDKENSNPNIILSQSNPSLKKGHSSSHTSLQYLSSYNKFKALINICWKGCASERPNFDTIVKNLCENLQTTVTPINNKIEALSVYHYQPEKKKINFLLEAQLRPQDELSPKCSILCSATTKKYSR